MPGEAHFVASVEVCPGLCLSSKKKTVLLLLYVGKALFHVD